MIDKKGFWIAQMIVLLAIYTAAAWVAIDGDTTHLLVRVTVLVLAAHVLEIPLAFARLKGLGATPLRVILLTFLFGLLWWMPARRGVFAVR